MPNVAIRRKKGKHYREGLWMDNDSVSWLQITHFNDSPQSHSFMKGALRPVRTG